MHIHLGSTSDRSELERIGIDQRADRKRPREEEGAVLSPHYPRWGAHYDVDASCALSEGFPPLLATVVSPLTTLPHELISVIAKGPSLAVFALLLQTCKALHRALRNHRGDLASVIANLSHPCDTLATLVAWADALSPNGDRKASEPALLRSLSQKMFGMASFKKTPSGVDEAHLKLWSDRVNHLLMHAAVPDQEPAIEGGRQSYRTTERLTQLRDLNIALYFVCVRPGAGEDVSAQRLADACKSLPALLTIPVLELICSFASTSAIGHVAGRFTKKFLEEFDGILPPISKSLRLLIGEAMCRFMSFSNSRRYLAERFGIPEDVLSNDWDPMIADIIVRQADHRLNTPDWTLPIDDEIDVEQAERFGLHRNAPRWFPVVSMYAPRRLSAPATLEEACEKWSPGNPIFEKTVVSAYLRYVVQKVPSDSRYLRTPSGSDIFQLRMSRNIDVIVRRVDAETIAALTPNAAAIDLFLGWHDRSDVPTDHIGLARWYAEIKQAPWAMQPVLMKRLSQCFSKEAKACDDIFRLAADMQVWRDDIVVRCEQYPQLLGYATSAAFYAVNACVSYAFPLSKEIDHYFARYPIDQWASPLDTLANIIPWDMPQRDYISPRHQLVEKLLGKVNLFLRHPDACLAFPSVRMHRLVIQQAGVVWSALTHLDALPDEKVRAFGKRFHFQEVHLKAIRESVVQAQIQRFLLGQCTISDAYAATGFDDPDLLRRMEEDVWRLRIQPEIGAPAGLEIASAKYGMGSTYLRNRANDVAKANDIARVREGK